MSGQRSPARKTHATHQPARSAPGSSIVSEELSRSLPHPVHLVGAGTGAPFGYVLALVTAPIRMFGSVTWAAWSLSSGLPVDSLSLKSKTLTDAYPRPQVSQLGEGLPDHPSGTLIRRPSLSKAPDPTPIGPPGGWVLGALKFGLLRCATGRSRKHPYVTSWRARGVLDVKCPVSVDRAWQSRPVATFARWIERRGSSSSRASAGPWSGSPSRGDSCVEHADGLIGRRTTDG